MRKTESNKLTMYSGVIAVMESNADIYTDTPVIVESLNEFKTVVEQIKNKDMDFKGRTKDETADKHIKEETLVMLVLKIANALYVLGVRTKNSELQINAKVTKSGLVSARDTLLVNKAMQILTFANSYKDSLVNYGIGETKISEAQTALDEFNAAAGSQAEEQAGSVASREELTQFFQKADALLKDELDPMIEMYEDVDSNFYNSYLAARVIKDLGIGKKSRESLA
jgi:hypothetical protein